MTVEYIAGFFDGEGCIYAAPDSAYVQVELAQTDRRPLDEMALLYGGNVRRGQTIYKWMVPSANVERFLRDILPHLIVKKRQAELAIEFRALIFRGNGRGKWIDLREKFASERSRIATEICEQKHVGIV